MKYLSSALSCLLTISFFLLFTVKMFHVVLYRIRGEVRKEISPRVQSTLYQKHHYICFREIMKAFVINQKVNLTIHAVEMFKEIIMLDVWNYSMLISCLYTILYTIPLI